MKLQSFPSRIVTLLFAIFTLSTSVVNADTNIRALSYYETPPLYNSDGRGLVYDIIDAIDDECSDINFDYKVFTRPVLDRLLINIEQPVIILLVNPLWFQDVDRTKYNWSLPIYSDSNAVISNKNDPIEFTGPETFKNQSVAVLKRHRFHILDQLVDQRLATRLNFSTIESIVQKIAQNNVRMAIIPFLPAYYQTEKHQLGNVIHFSSKSQHYFERHLLLKNVSPEDEKQINQAIETLQKNGRLKEILAKYGY